MNDITFLTDFENSYISMMKAYEAYDDKRFDGKIYHYTRIDSLEAILKNQCLWITKSDFLNDKSEFVYAFEIIDNVYNFSKFDYISKRLFKRFITVIKSILNKCFVFSSSLNSDSLTLWGNYSNFDGYNIQFDMNVFFDRLWNEKIFISGNKKDSKGVVERFNIERKGGGKVAFVTPGDVIYDYEYQKTIINDFLNCINELYRDFYSKALENECDIEYFNMKILRILNIFSEYIQLFKNPCFAHEEEKRIIFQVNSRIDVVKYRKYAGAFIPYIEVQFEDNNQKEKGLPISGVSIGPKNNLDIAFLGLKEFIKSQGYNVISNNKSEIKQCNSILISKSKVPLRY